MRRCSHFVFGLSLILFTVLSTLMVYVSLATADDVYISSEASIQAAISKARSGDRIVLQPGLYKENIDFLGKAVTIRGTNPNDPDVVAATIIDGGRAGSVVTFAHGEGSDSVLSGVTIRNGKASQGGGILCSFSSPTITNCVITVNLAANRGGGIYTESSSSILINLSLSISRLICTAAGPLRFPTRH